MKRELKGTLVLGTVYSMCKLTKLIPMKRELKEYFAKLDKADAFSLTKLIPMKRELKASIRQRYSGWYRLTKLIPMKRELKADERIVPFDRQKTHKANPYEKGTESGALIFRPNHSRAAHKANPYEKGTESAHDPCRAFDRCICSQS